MSDPIKLITSKTVIDESCKDVLSNALSFDLKGVVVFGMLSDGRVLLEKSDAISIVELIAALEMAKQQAYLSWAGK